MTMVAWRSYHKHAPQYRSNWHLLSASKAVRYYTHRHTMNTGLSTKRLKTNMIEPTVNDVLALPKFILLLTNMYVHSKLMIITGLLYGNTYM